MLKDCSLFHTWSVNLPCIWFLGTGWIGVLLLRHAEAIPEESHQEGLAFWFTRGDLIKSCFVMKLNFSESITIFQQNHAKNGMEDVPGSSFLPCDSQTTYWSRSIYSFKHFLRCMCAPVPCMYMKKKGLEIWLKPYHCFCPEFECSCSSPNTADPLTKWYLLEEDAHLVAGPRTGWWWPDTCNIGVSLIVTLRRLGDI